MTVTNIEETRDRVVCGECGAVGVHAEDCSQRGAAEAAADAERIGEESRARQVEVDGEPATFVVDETPPFIERTVDELVGVVAEMRERVEKTKSAKKRVSEALKSAQEDLDVVTTELIERWHKERNTPLPFPAEPQAETEVEIDDEFAEEVVDDAD